jgi:hypothetical protein
MRGLGWYLLELAVGLDQRLGDVAPPVLAEMRPLRLVLPRGLELLRRGLHRHRDRLRKSKPFVRPATWECGLWLTAATSSAAPGRTAPFFSSATNA